MKPETLKQLFKIAETNGVRHSKPHISEYHTHYFWTGLKSFCGMLFHYDADNFYKLCKENNLINGND